MHSWMRNFWLDVILMNYEGMSDYTLCYTFDGTDSDFGEINADNGYLLKQQEGKKATLMVAEKIAKRQTVQHAFPLYDADAPAGADRFSEKYDDGQPRGFSHRR